MIEYCNGLLFNSNRTKVALIEKLKPAFQYKKLNGIGGKIEEGEQPIDALVREFKEETGADVLVWRYFLTLSFQSTRIYFYETNKDVEIKTIEKEIVGWYDLSELTNLPLIPNLKWIIPLALDKDYVSGFVTDPS